MLGLVLLLSAPDVARLNHPSWGRREFAELRLAALGPLAWPALLAAADADDPETRHRCRRLLAPYRRLCGFVEAAGVLLADEPPKPWDLFRDESLRFRVWTLATRGGVPAWRCRMLHPSADPSLGAWPWGLPAWCGMAAEVEECRAFFRDGVEPAPGYEPYP